MLTKLIKSTVVCSSPPLTMVKYLALAFLLCALWSLSDASCYRKLSKAGQTHCQDDTDLTWHAVGSSWRNSACMECSCQVEELGCCTAFSIPRRFPEDCESVFDSESCQYIVRKKNDPSTHCPIFEAVMK